MATCPTFSWGRGSVYHIGRHYQRRKEMPKKQKKNESRRTEKKEKLKTQKKG